MLRFSSMLRFRLITAAGALMLTAAPIATLADQNPVARLVNSSLVEQGTFTSSLPPYATSAATSDCGKAGVQCPTGNVCQCISLNGSATGGGLDNSTLTLVVLANLSRFFYSASTAACFPSAGKGTLSLSGAQAQDSDDRGALASVSLDTTGFFCNTVSGKAIYTGGYSLTGATASSVVRSPARRSFAREDTDDGPQPQPLTVSGTGTLNIDLDFTDRDSTGVVLGGQESVTINGGWPTVD